MRKEGNRGSETTFSALEELEDTASFAITENKLWEMLHR